MIKRTPWLEKKFNFDFPVSHFPLIVTRLRGTSARINDLTQNIPDEILSLRKGEGWSVKEHIGHLTDLESLHEKRLQEYLDGIAKLTPADMTNEKTYSANHNSKPLSELIEDLRADRKIFVSKLEELQEEDLKRVALHPRLQQIIRLVDMAFFVAEHDDQHIAAISELISQ